MYLDWMGCMDIAHGVSEIFGINLDKGFLASVLLKEYAGILEKRDGIFHLVHGFKVIYYPAYQCQHCVRKINKFKERNGAIRFPVHFQL